LSRLKYLWSERSTAVKLMRRAFRGLDRNASPFGELGGVRVSSWAIYASLSIGRDLGGFDKTQADVLWNVGLSYRYSL
jgi:hypothetical protein